MAAHVLVYYLALAAATLMALRWGGAPEKAFAGIAIVALGASLILQSPYSLRYTRLEVGVLAVDAAAAVAFLYLALVADRWWTLWAAAFQIIAAGAHAAKLLNPFLLPSGYAVMLGASAYPHVLMLVVGVINERARGRGRIAPISWRGFLNAAGVKLPNSGRGRWSRLMDPCQRFSRYLQAGERPQSESPPPQRRLRGSPPR